MGGNPMYLFNLQLWRRRLPRMANKLSLYKSFIPLIVAVIVNLLMHRAIFYPISLKDYIDSKTPLYYLLNTHDIYVTIASTLALNTYLCFSQAIELIYFICDMLSIFVIWVSTKDSVKITNSAIICLTFGLLFFLLYPYNKIMDTNFVALYVLMTLVSSLTISYLSFVNRCISTYTYTNRVNISFFKITLLRSIFLLSPLVILYVVFTEDPRFLLYPALLLLMLATLAIIMYVISSDRVSSLIFITSIVPCLFLVICLLLIGFIRIREFVTLRAYIPFNKDAFRCTTLRTQLYFLLTGTSWTFVNVTDVSFILLVIGITMLLVLILYILDKENSMIILLIVNMLIVITLYINIGGKSMILHLLDLIVWNSPYILFLLNNTSWGSFIKCLLLMFRVPRYVDFTFKTIMTCLIIWQVPLKHSSSKIIRRTIMSLLLLIIMCQGSLIRLPIMRGSILNMKQYILAPYSTSVIDNGFDIKDWAKDKLIFEAYLREKILSPSLFLLYDYVVVDSTSRYASILSRLGNQSVNLGRFRIIKFSNPKVIIGLPLLLLRGLVNSHLYWKNKYLLPIYLDQYIGPSILSLIERIPLYVNVNTNYTLELTLSIILNCYENKILLIQPAIWCNDYSPSFIWSPGFIGDPHHGIFDEPPNYEYDYTFKLEYGVAQLKGFSKYPLQILIYLKEANTYYTFIRLMGSGEGFIEVRVDNRSKLISVSSKNSIKNVKFKKRFIGFEWRYLGIYNLSRGYHSIKISCIGTPNSKVYINLITLIPADLFERVLNKIRRTIRVLKHEQNILRYSRLISKVKVLRMNIDRVRGNFEVHLFTNPDITTLIIVLPVLWGVSTDVQIHGNVTDFLIVPVDYVVTGILLINPYGEVKVYVRWSSESYLTIKLITVIIALASIVLIRKYQTT